MHDAEEHIHKWGNNMTWKGTTQSHEITGRRSLLEEVLDNDAQQEFPAADGLWRQWWKHFDDGRDTAKPYESCTEKSKCSIE